MSCKALGEPIRQKLEHTQLTSLRWKCCTLLRCQICDCEIQEIFPKHQLRELCIIVPTKPGQTRSRFLSNISGLPLLEKLKISVEEASVQHIPFHTLATHKKWLLNSVFQREANSNVKSYRSLTSLCICHEFALSLEESVKVLTSIPRRQMQEFCAHFVPLSERMDLWDYDFAGAPFGGTPLRAEAVELVTQFCALFEEVAPPIKDQNLDTSFMALRGLLVSWCA